MNKNSTITFSMLNFLYQSYNFVTRLYIYIYKPQHFGL